jgi:hypothetical protein
MNLHNPARSRILRDVALACLLLAPLAQGAFAATSKDQGDSIDEVVVKGSRSQLDLIRHEMVMIEDRFYERYNELNTNHDFDTHCHMNQDPPQPWVPPTTPTIMIEARRKDYQNNIRNVVKKNPELVEMLKERYELGQRYEATQHKIFGSKAEKEAETAEPLAPNPP